MPQRVAITGATGFVGRHVAGALVRRGHRVHVVARPGADITPLASLTGATVIRAGTTSAALEAALAPVAPDVVVHLAAAFRPDASAAGVDEMVAANVAFGTALLHAARASGCGAFVHTGTYSQHLGAGRGEVSNLYAALKQAFEEVLAYYVSAYALRAMTLVLHDNYGPADPRGKLLSLLTEAAATGVPLVASPGDQRLDLLHVDDVAEAFAVAVERVATFEAGHFERRAVRSGNAISPRELAGIVQQVLGREVPVRWGGRPHRPREIMTPPELPVLEGWQPRIPLDVGLRQVLLGEPLPGRAPR